MRKNFRAITMIAVVMFLVICVGASLTVQAKTKKHSVSKKAVSKKSKAASNKSTGRVARKSSGKKKQVASSRSRRSRAVRSVGSKRQVKSARNRVVRGSNARLSRSARRRRARALALARMRAARARDAALRNITAANVEKDNPVGEDLEIRQAALAAMSGRSATVVVMDPNTGRVYTIVNQRMALGSPVKPCSTVKMIVGLAALRENVFDPSEELVRSRKYGPLNLTEALAHSDNPFFQTLGKMTGYDKVIKYADNFGFGQKTGVNYPGESEGFVPEEGTTLMPSHGDGFGVTAMQLAAFTAAIANGGNLYIPRVPRTTEDAADFKPELKRKIEMTQEDRAKMMPGMIGAVNYGTARRAASTLGQVAGKTGTCTGDRDKLRLFTSFSSVENPKLVVTVITTDSKFGGNHATEIAGKIYAAVAPRFFRE
ncbi:MAG: penicillin-binding transpeptidase domain-containing protein, partial [Blastocatellia bacterium]